MALDALCDVRVGAHRASMRARSAACSAPSVPPSAYAINSSSVMITTRLLPRRRAALRALRGRGRDGSSPCRWNIEHGGRLFVCQSFDERERHDESLFVGSRASAASSDNRSMCASLAASATCSPRLLGGASTRSRRWRARTSSIHAFLMIPYIQLSSRVPGCVDRGASARSSASCTRSSASSGLRVSVRASLRNLGRSAISCSCVSRPIDSCLTSITTGGGDFLPPSRGGEHSTMCGYVQRVAAVDGRSCGERCWWHRWRPCSCMSRTRRSVACRCPQLPGRVGNLPGTVTGTVNGALGQVNDRLDDVERLADVRQLRVRGCCVPSGSSSSAIRMARRFFGPRSWRSRRPMRRECAGRGIHGGGARACARWARYSCGGVARLMACRRGGR